MLVMETLRSWTLERPNLQQEGQHLGPPDQKIINNLEQTGDRKQPIFQNDFSRLSCTSVDWALERNNESKNGYTWHPFRSEKYVLNTEKNPPFQKSGKYYHHDFINLKVISKCTCVLIFIVKNMSWKIKAPHSSILVASSSSKGRRLFCISVLLFSMEKEITL